MDKYLKCLAVMLPLVALGACSKSQQASAPAETAPAPAPSEQAAAPAGADSAAIDAALASPGRLAGDSDEDGWRKTGDVLRFLGLRPGMHVLDYFSAGGYNTELMSYVVGPQGHVIAYNNEPYLKFSEKKPAERYGNNRLPNVEQLTAAPEEAPFKPSSLDGVLFVMSYHDLYWKPQDRKISWSTDPAKSLARLVPALRPGGVVVVVDHVATAGADPSATMDAMHRIDPAIVRRDFEAAGLVFDGESDVLRNPADDHSKPVFDESIRRKTDRFVYRFRKP
jgi:predicted methyltransferase